MICIIILSLCARDLKKKYDCSQCIYKYFRPSLVFFFLSQGERDLHFVPGFVEKKKHSPVGFFRSVSRELSYFVYTISP